MFECYRAYLGRNRLPYIPDAEASALNADSTYETSSSSRIILAHSDEEIYPASRRVRGRRCRCCGKTSHSKLTGRPARWKHHINDSAPIPLSDSMARYSYSHPPGHVRCFLPTHLYIPIFRTSGFSGDSQLGSSKTYRAYATYIKFPIQRVCR